MAHYDLYQTLGLDRAASTQDLDRQLNDRISAAGGDPAALDELSTARAVLGNDTRRSMYDQRLDDPNAPEIDVASLKDLASLNVTGTGGTEGAAGAAAPQGGFQQQAGQFARQAGDRAGAAGREVKDSFRQSNLLAIIITAVVTAVVVLAGGWGIGRLVGGGDTQDFSAAESVVDDMLEQNNADDLRDWLQNHTLPDDRDGILSTMNVSDSGSSSFSGMDSHFGGSGLHAATGLNLEQLAVLTGETLEDAYESAEDDGFSREEAETTAVIGVQDDDDEFRGVITLIERDGDYKLMEISQY